MDYHVHYTLKGKPFDTVVKRRHLNDVLAMAKQQHADGIAHSVSVHREEHGMRINVTSSFLGTWSSAPRKGK